MATSARLEELQQKFNENPRRYFAPLANEHRKLGDLEQAITLCRTHLPHQPQHVSGHIVLAQALFEAGNTPDARQSFELALDLDPENLIALRFLGDIAREHGDHATARQWYERVLDADPRNDEIARLVRELENGAAAALAVEKHVDEEVAEDVVLHTPAVTEPEPHVAFVPNDALVHDETPLALPEPLEDLATAWQHEVAALDSPYQPEAAEFVVKETPASVEALETAGEPEPAPVAEAFEPVAEQAEPVADVAESEFESVTTASYVDAAAAPEAASEPNESWAEPDEEFVASVPPVEQATTPAPPAFAEIDYSMFEAVADEDDVAAPASETTDIAATFEPADVAAAFEPAEVAHAFEPSADAPVFEPTDVAPESELTDVAQPEESVVAEAPHVPGDDWFAMPSGREAETIATEPPVEASFDLDAAFQSVLPNQESEEPAAPVPQALADSDDVPHSREWEVPATYTPIAESETFSLQPDAPDSVDDAFAELDRLTASLDASGSAMLLPDEEYTASEQGEAAHHFDSAIARTPDSGIPAVEPQPLAFVTETMAELYLQQGFRDEALAVYRQLLTMNPSDGVLAARVSALEGPDAAVAPSEEPAPYEEAFRPMSPVHADPVGQSMRAFLAVFARRRAPMRRREPVRAAARAAEQAQTSGLSALFGSSSGADDGVAAVLAGAFVQPNADSEALPGRPTRAAAQELSLGDVFGGGAAASGVRAASFDEFFSTGSANESVRSPLDEEGSDMEQFTAWLEGLKKK